jgi:hypothetical protein
MARQLPHYLGFDPIGEPFYKFEDAFEEFCHLEAITVRTKVDLLKKSNSHHQRFTEWRKKSQNKKVWNQTSRLSG